MGAGAGCGCGVAGLVEDVSRLATAGCGPDSSPGARGRTLIEGLDKVRGRLRADPQLREEIGAELGKRAAERKAPPARRGACAPPAPSPPPRPAAPRGPAMQARARLRRLRAIHQSPDVYAAALRSRGVPISRVAGLVPSASGGVLLHEDDGPPGSVRVDSLSELARSSLATLVLRPRTAVIYANDVTHPDVPVDPYDPDLEIPDEPGVSRAPLGSTCYRYRAVLQEPTVTTPGAGRFPSRPRPNFEPSLRVDLNRHDPCDPMYDDLQLVDFDTCLPASFTYGEAVRILEGHGLDPTREVWRVLTDWFDGADIDPDALGLIPEDTSWSEPFAGEPLWNQWDPATSKYVPVTTSTPRKAALFGALRLVCGLEAGIPAEVEGARLRDEVAGRIRDGDMEYRLYGQSPGANTTDLLALGWEVLGLLWTLLSDQGWEVEVLIQVLDGLDGDNDLDPALLDALYALEELLIELVLQPAQCPGKTAKRVTCLPGTQATNPTCGAAGEVGPRATPCTPPCPGGTMDLRNGVVFVFTGGGSGHNHGLFSRRVWLCMDTVDQVAVAADWLLALGTRHLARSLVPTLPVAEQEAHYLAYTVVMRMYASALASLGQWLVHETAHNINLYHCYDPWTSRAMGCQQDHARATWLAYTHARLGMGLTLEFNNALQVQWDAAVWRDTVQGFPTAGGVRQPLPSVWACGDGMLRITALECEQSAPGGVAYTLGTTAALLALALVFRSAGLAVLAEWVLLAVAQARLHGLDDDANASTAWAEFSIDRILQLGGKVQRCCIRAKAGNCLPAGSPVSGPCWPTDAPDDAQRCCDVPCTRAQPGANGDGSGGSRPYDGPTPFDPVPPITVWGKDDDVTWRNPSGSTSPPDDTPELNR